MNRRLNPRLTMLVVVLLAIPATGIVYMLGSPAITAASPQTGDVAVPIGAPLQVTFSRPMNPDSVTQHLQMVPEVQGSFTWEGRTLTFRPDKAWPSGSKIQVRLAAGARAAGLLSLPTQREVSWSFTTNYPRLAYLAPESAAANVYLLDPLSGSSRQLTNTLGGVLEFDAAWDGSALYFSVRGAQGSSSLYRVEGIHQPSQQEMPRPVPVLECPQAECRTPRISPQGDLLAYERTAFPGGSDPTYSQVWLLPLDPPGGEPRLAGDPGHQTFQPAWSSTGWLSFYDSNLPGFVFLDPQSGQRQVFSNQTGLPGAWSPDGQYFTAPEVGNIAAVPQGTTSLHALANSHLMRFERPNGSVTNLSVDEAWEDAFPAYSLDGELLAFARNDLHLERWTPGRQLWVMEPDGDNPRQLTNEPYFNHYAFTWNPNGEQLAFVRFDQISLTSPPEIWVIEPATGRSTRLVEGGYAPLWIP